MGTGTAGPRHIDRLLQTTLLIVVSVGLLVATTGTAVGAPTTPTNLPVAIEVRQPYVGQAVCDPVAKPGVRAFSALLLSTYPTTSSLGIVRDCGAGGQSEHKEGRAFDWGVSVYNPTHRANVADVMAWLTATDRDGNTFAMARRLGIMYMIWNKQIWKAYDDRGWQAYSGPSPHTDHVHFSFGWNGAKKVTSFWDGTVAPLDYGPGTLATKGFVTPSPSVENIAVVRTYGGLTLDEGSRGTAVATMQRALKITADGAYGPMTAAAVTAFQRSQGVPVSGSFGPSDWRLLFPRPSSPLGALEVLRTDLQLVRISGWTTDYDVTTPVYARVVVDGVTNTWALANRPRTDIASKYPEQGSDLGFAFDLTLAEGVRTVCVDGANAAGTPGLSTRLGCRTLTVKHSPGGTLSAGVQPPASPGVRVRGWALDPDVVTPLRVGVQVNGARVTTVSANAASGTSARAAGYTQHGTLHGFATTLTLPEGTQQICAVGLNATGTPGRDRSHGCVTTVVRHRPIGGLESVSLAPGQVLVKGWALDPDTALPVSVRVDVDGRAVRTTLASGLRTDIALTNPGYGADLGHAVSLTGLAEGSHSVCTTALNSAGTPGADRLLGCRTVAVRTTPTGLLDAPRTTPGDQVAGMTSVTGWALDPDTTGPVAVRLTVDGTPVRTVQADRTDARSTPAWPGYGGSHGFRADLALAEGSRRICAYAQNAAGTPGLVTAELGCRVVTVRHTPVGQLLGTITTPGANAPGTTVVRGWALDPDVLTPVAVRIDVDGRPAATVTAAYATGVVPAAWSSYGNRRAFRADLTLSAGSRQVCAYALNAPVSPGGAAPSLGCRTVLVRHDPVGALRPISTAPGPQAAGTTQITGWALDPDSRNAVVVDVVVDGIRVSETSARLTTGSVPATWSAYGTSRAFRADIAMAAGERRVCAYARNVGGTPGVRTLLGCQSVLVAHSPVGSAPSLTTVRTGVVRLTGWALDPDTTAPIGLHLWVDGRYSRTITASTVSSAAARAWPGHGDRHGYAVDLALSTGVHRVCVWALNAPGSPGANAGAGCASITTG